MDGERALLALDGVVAGYDEVEVLRGVSVAVRSNEIVAIPRLLHVGPRALSTVGERLHTHGFDTSHVLVGSGCGPSQDFAAVVTTSLREAVHVQLTEHDGQDAVLLGPADLERGTAR